MIGITNYLNYEKNKFKVSCINIFNAGICGV